MSEERIRQELKRFERNDYDSLFINLEGIDGCGKSTQVIKLFDFFWSVSKIYSNVLVAKEPTYYSYGWKQRQLLVNDIDPLTNIEACIENYVFNRDEHKEVTVPVLRTPAGIVIMDRHYASTVAFQISQAEMSYKKKFGNPMPLDEKLAYMTKLLEFHNEKGIVLPDVTFLLDLSVEVALSRMNSAKRGSDKFEKKDFLEVVRQNYLLLADFDESIVVVDAEHSPDKVFDQIKNVLLDGFIMKKCPDYLKTELGRDLANYSNV